VATMSRAPVHQQEGQGAWVLRHQATFWPDPVAGCLTMFRRQIFAYHALVSLATIQ
jgi:hypothetical protein